MAHLRRAALREQLRMAEAVRAGGIVGDDWQKWRDDTVRALEG